MDIEGLLVSRKNLVSNNKLPARTGPAGPEPVPFLFFSGRPHNIFPVRAITAPFLEIEDEPEFSETLDTEILEADATAWAELFAVPPGAVEALRKQGERSADRSLKAIEDQVREIQRAHGWEHHGLSDIVVSTMTNPPPMSANVTHIANEGWQEVWLQAQLAIEDRAHRTPAGEPTPGLASFVIDLAARLTSQLTGSASSRDQRIPAD